MPRKAFHPTEEDRRVVKMLAAVGIPQEDIALKLDLKSPKTLRKYFPDELRLGSIEAEASVRGRIYKDATAGNTRAQQIWMNCISPNRRNAQFRPFDRVPALIIETQVSAPEKPGTILDRYSREAQKSEVENHEQ